MNRRHRLVSFLLLGHLFACAVWLWMVHAAHNPPMWAVTTFFCSTLGVQFSWGFTVGLVAGPSRRRRRLLWASLLTLFMPLYFIAPLFRVLVHFLGLPTALCYLGVLVMILACETFCGILLGARLHSREQNP